MTLTRTLAVALTTAAVAAPTAVAQPIDIHTPLAQAADKANHQDLRSPDARDAARPTKASDSATTNHQDLRSPDARDAARPTKASDSAVSGDQAALRAALAQERYYSSYGEPAPLARTVPTATDDTAGGIDTLPFVLSLFGALLVGVGAGTGLLLAHTRRRLAT
jgi:hypothetical protein